MREAFMIPPLEDMEIVHEEGLPERVRAWVASPAAVAAIEHAVRESIELTSRLCEAQRVDPKVLHEPITR